MRPKYLIGTLFQEEQLDQKLNANTIKNKDPMGNTRWQGAFTGGFSAGYKNTCGSKQGWQPAQFVSSVSKRAQKKDQNIKDFMDKEDLGKESITTNIVINDAFTSDTKNPFNIVVETSIGEKILAKMKKASAIEVVPQNQEDLDKLLKYYEHQEIIQEHTKQASYNFKDLEKPFSVGGSEMNCEEDEFIDNYEELYRRVIRATVKEETEEERQKRIQQNKVYFDFTKPMEEQPQYLKEIHQIEDLEKPKKRKKNLLNMLRLRDLFSQAVEFKEFTKESNIEKAPEDYDPYHRIRDIKDFLYAEKKKGQEDVDIKPKHRIYSIAQRQDILGTQKLSSKFRSASNSFMKGNESKISEIKAYFTEDKKNRRYIDYVQELQGRKIACQNEYLSFQEAEKEREEFDIMYKKQKEEKIKSNLRQKEEAGNYVKEGKLPQELERILSEKKEDSGQVSIIRTVTPWRPSQALCKKFGCLLPYKIDQGNKKGQMQEYF